MLQKESLTLFRSPDAVGTADTISPHGKKPLNKIIGSSGKCLFIHLIVADNKFSAFVEVVFLGIRVFTHIKRRNLAD